MPFLKVERALAASSRTSRWLWPVRVSSWSLIFWAVLWETRPPRWPRAKAAAALTRLEPSWVSLKRALASSSSCSASRVPSSFRASSVTAGMSPDSTMWTKFCTGPGASSTTWKAEGASSTGGSGSGLAGAFSAGRLAAGVLVLRGPLTCLVPPLTVLVLVLVPPLILTPFLVLIFLAPVLFFLAALGLGRVAGGAAGAGVWAGAWDGAEGGAEAGVWAGFDGRASSLKSSSSMVFSSPVRRAWMDEPFSDSRPLGSAGDMSKVGPSETMRRPETLPIRSSSRGVGSK